ncbi:MAG: DUF3237 domain-containing protein [Novosphingobium sp.]|uniref:DUF3237 domain-containing protein n=1 Tax=Novosphingobium sp. TaxID=1874826 RepID=UPI003B9DA07D
MTHSRRTTLGLLGAALPLVAARSASAAPMSPLPKAAEPKLYDKPGVEWVMDIVPVCSDPEPMGPAGDTTAADGKRDVAWPITCGYFTGRGIKGTVIPGGGDFPVTRPDGVEVVDALYRLKTDDGVQIIIHNRGLAYSEETFRLLPTFNVPGSKYAWLRESVFVATLTYPVPPAYAANLKANGNGRLIQVYRLV